MPGEQVRKERQGWQKSKVEIQAFKARASGAAEKGGGEGRSGKRG